MVMAVVLHVLPNQVGHAQPAQMHCQHALQYVAMVSFMAMKSVMIPLTSLHLMVMVAVPHAQLRPMVRVTLIYPRTFAPCVDRTERRVVKPVMIIMTQTTMDAPTVRLMKAGLVLKQMACPHVLQTLL